MSVYGRGRIAAIAWCMGASVWLHTAVAYGHAFGQRYDLPVPLWLYVTAAAAAVVFSFVVIGIFVKGAKGVRRYRRINLLRYRIGRILCHPALTTFAKITSTVLFVLLIVAGFAGNQHPLMNISPTLVWVLWWVGLAYISALGGNLWILINPWKIIYEAMEALYQRISRGKDLSRSFRYPEGLGVWPAVLLFLGFCWVELVFHGSAIPVNISRLALAYSVITWTGMFLFGKEKWLLHGEVFTLFFGLLARFAPTEIRVIGSEACASCRLECRDRDGECINCYSCFERSEPEQRQWNLRPFAVGLLRNERVSLSMMVLALLILSTVTFDGFMATPAWSSIQSYLQDALSVRGAEGVSLVQTIGLLLFPAVFAVVYLAFCSVMAAVSGRRISTKAFAQSFAFSLVPIAIGYHLAHYLSFLLIQGQRIIPLASDPLGIGWNLFGTVGYRVNIGIVGARFVWFTAVSAIVLGHIAAVYLAHVIAIRTLGERTSALRSQYPMLALMVGYTVVSLWIIAQPIVEKRAGRPVAAKAKPAGPRKIAVPADARLPALGTGMLREVGEGKTARVRIVYRALNSTSQDGTETTVADLLYPYIFAYRWSRKASSGDHAYDPSVEKSTALMRQSLLGLRVLRVEKNVRGFGQLKIVFNMPVIEVYLDALLQDRQKTASIAPPWSPVPWHVMVLMEEAVLRGWAAFSRQEAQRRGVEWLDLARSESLRRLMAPLVKSFEREGFFPRQLEGLVTADEARQRWKSLRSFYEKYGHFLATSGPYILDKWSKEAVVLKVFRDLRYPLGVGSFNKYALPTRAYITNIEQREDGIHISADVEKVEKAGRSYRILREPLKKSSLVGIYRVRPVCKYVILGPDGEVIKVGTASFGEDNTFTVAPDARLKPGLYKILVTIYLNENYITPDIRMIPYSVSGA